MVLESFQLHRRAEYRDQSVPSGGLSHRHHPRQVHVLHYLADPRQADGYNDTQDNFHSRQSHLFAMSLSAVDQHHIMGKPWDRFHPLWADKAEAQVRHPKHPVLVKSEGQRSQQSLRKSLSRISPKPLCSSHPPR